MQAYASMCQYMLAYAWILLHVGAYASICPHMLAYGRPPKDGNGFWRARRNLFLAFWKAQKNGNGFWRACRNLFPFFGPLYIYIYIYVCVPGLLKGPKRRKHILTSSSKSARRNFDVTYLVCMYACKYVCDIMWACLLHPSLSPASLPAPSRVAKPSTKLWYVKLWAYFSGASLSTPAQRLAWSSAVFEIGYAVSCYC